MGENEAASDDAPSKIAKDGDRKNSKVGRAPTKKEEYISDVSASPKPLYPNPKRRRIEQDKQDADTIISDYKNQSQSSEAVDVSPVTKSRYGRTHKPKIPEDFLPTDKKVAAILGRSPHKSPGKVSGSPNSLTSADMTNVCQKGRRLYDIFMKKDRRSKGNTESEGLNKSNHVGNVKLEKSDISDSIKVETPTVNVLGISDSLKMEVNSGTSDVLVEKNKTPGDKKTSGIDWVIGDLAWARVTGYPFWPCMIALDPQIGNFTRTTVRGNITVRSMHVQFFGDNGRRSWLYCTCVIPFEGLDALNKLSVKIQNEVPKKRDRKLAAAFHVGPKAKAKWDIAVSEAEESLRKTRIQRLQDFATRFPLDASDKSAKSDNMSGSPQDRQNVIKLTKTPKSENLSPSPQGKSPVKPVKMAKFENRSPSPKKKFGNMSAYSLDRYTVKVTKFLKSENQSSSPQDTNTVKATNISKAEKILKSEKQTASPQKRQNAVKLVTTRRSGSRVASPKYKHGVKTTKLQSQNASPQMKRTVKMTKSESQMTSPQSKQNVKTTKLESQMASPQSKQNVKATKLESQIASPRSKQSVRPTKLENQTASPNKPSGVKHKQQKRISDYNTSPPKAVSKVKSENSFRPPSPELLTDTYDEEWTSSSTSDNKVKNGSPPEKKKKNRKKGEGDFEAFLYKHLDRVSQEHPELSIKKVEKYLAKEWAEMDDREKSKFSARLNENDDKMERASLSSSEDEEEEEDEKEMKDERDSNSSEKADSSGTRESSPAPLFKLKKGGGLFRGTKQEKVCQICEKPGDTVKCRGPCSGAFHLECVSKLEKESTNVTTENSVEDKVNGVGIGVQSEEVKIEDSESCEVIHTDSHDEVVSTVADFDEHKKEKNTEIRKEIDTNSQNEVTSTVGESCQHIKQENTGGDKNSIKNVKISEKISENNNCMPTSTENGLAEESDNLPVSRKRKRSETEDEIRPCEKIVFKEIGNVELSEGKEVADGRVSATDDYHVTEIKDNDLRCTAHIKGNVNNDNGVKMDINETTVKDVGNDSCEDTTGGSDHVTTCSSETKKGDEVNTNNLGLEEGESVLKSINETKESNFEDVKDSNEETNKEKEIEVIPKRERRSIYKKREEELKERYVKEKRNSVKRKDEGRKQNTTKGDKELKDSKVISEEEDKEEKKDRKSIAKKKDKEEKKGKGNDIEEKGNEITEFRCRDCQAGRNPPCFGCGEIKEKKTGREQRLRCILAHCGKFYHMECLKLWPHASSSGGAPSRRHSAAAARGEDLSISHCAVTCPQHVCHTCASDDPRNATTRFAHERLARCIRCPTAYHTGNYCLPAGSEVLTGSQIICPKHYKPPQKKTYHVNAAWCFICAMGGSLICCDLCPTAFHAECVKISPPEGSFICEDCDTGRFPLYGEIVWVKLGSYRWWPAQILYPNQIPENIGNLPHLHGEFAVRFFGTHDHYWVNRGRVFLYQEGDTGHSTSRKSYMEGMFSRALQEASEAQAILKSERAVRESEAVLKPPMYVKIRSNRPVGNVRVMEMDPASMTPCDCDPNSENPCGPDTDCLNRWFCYRICR